MRIPRPLCDGLRSARNFLQRRELALDSRAKMLAANQDRALLAGIITSAMDGIIAIDSQQRIVLFNPAAEKLFGCRAEDVIGGSIDRFIPESLRSLHRQHVEQFSATGTTTRSMTGRADLIGLRYNGTEFPIEACISSTKVEGRQLMTVTLHDITERKRAETRLHEYERALEGLEEMVVVIDRDYHYTLANHAYLRNHSIEGALEGHRVDKVLSDRFIKKIKHNLDESFAGKPIRCQMKFELPKLGERELLGSFFPLDGPRGIERVAVILQDITDKMRAERALVESDKRFRRLFQESPLIVALATLDEDRIIDVNHTFESTTGYSRQEAIGKTSLELGLWDNPEQYKELNSILVAHSGKLRNVECRFRNRQGELVIGLLSSEMIEIADKACTLSATVDITELKRTQQVVQRSEEKFSKVFRMGPMPLSLSKLSDGTYLDVNDSFENIYGFKRDEVIGKGATDLGLWKPSDRKDLLNALLSEGRVRNKEYWIAAKNGMCRAGLISAELLEIDNELCALISTVDITDLKQAQEELMAEKTLSDAIFATVPGVLFLMDEEGHLVRWNRQAERFTGYSAKEFLGRSVFELHADKERIRDMFRNVPEAGHAEFETELRRKDGVGVPFYCTAAYVFIDKKRYFFEVGIDLREHRRVENERLGLSARLITAQDEERSRIARELHDDVSQKVALLGIQLDQLLQSASVNLRLKAQLSEIKSRTTEVASTLHHLSREIHPSNLSRLGFRIALQGLCREMMQRGLAVHLTCKNVPSSLPPDISLCFFRVAQEALNNVLKHSGVREAEVEVVGGTGGIQMRITDRGRGFDPESKDFQAGLGLLSMRERLLLVGGNFSVRRQPGGGMEIEADVAFNSAQIPLSA